MICNFIFELFVVVWRLRARLVMYSNMDIRIKIFEYFLNKCLDNKIKKVKKLKEIIKKWKKDKCWIVFKKKVNIEAAFGLPFKRPFKQSNYTNQTPSSPFKNGRLTVHNSFSTNHTQNGSKNIQNWSHFVLLVDTSI